MLWYNSTADRFQFRVSDTSTHSVATAHSLGSPETDTWYFIVATYNTAQDYVSIQVNNQFLDSRVVTAAPSDGSSATTLGASTTIPTDTFNGRIDAVGFWKRLLTATERIWLYNAGQGRSYPALAGPGYINLKSDLQAYWDLDETSGLRSDRHGNNHLSDHNTVTSAPGVSVPEVSAAETTEQGVLEQSDRTVVSSPRPATQKSVGRSLLDSDPLVSAGTPTTTGDINVLSDSLVFPTRLEIGHPLFQDTSLRWTIVNSNDDDNRVMITVLDEEGNPAPDRELLHIGPQAQLSLSREEIPGWGEAGVLVADDAEGGIQGFLLASDLVKKVDGIGGALGASETLYFPWARQTSREATQLLLFNSAKTDNRVQLTLFDQDGIRVVERTTVIPSSGSLRHTLEGIFGEGLRVTEGYVRVKAEFPLTGCQFYAGEEHLSAVAAQVPERRPSLVVPHFFVDEDWGTTRIRLLNTGEHRARIAVTAFSDDHSLLGSRTFELEPRALHSFDVSEVIDGELGLLTGFLELELTEDLTPGAEVVGTVSFLGNRGQFHSLLPLTQAGRLESVFPQLAQSPEAGVFTGVVLFNPGPQEALVRVEAYDQKGVRTAERLMVLPSRHRIMDLLNSDALFGDRFRQMEGHLSVSSTFPIIAFALVGDYDLEFLSALEGQNATR